MRHFRKFWPNFANISHDCHAIVVRHSYDSHETFVIVSHDTFVRISLSLFSRQIVASCSHFLNGTEPSMVRMKSMS